MAKVLDNKRKTKKEKKRAREGKVLRLKKKSEGAEMLVPMTGIEPDLRSHF